MPYVKRNEDNKIIAQFARKQFNDQEFVKTVDESELYVSESSQIALREAAYASRSDKFFLEAMRKDAEGDTEGADEARALGLAEVALIKEEYPL
jgi:hypothetical protein